MARASSRDAAAALDWAQAVNPEARACWIAGVSFGSWIGMQLLMRRPEIEGFVSVAPPANRFDFSFLAPCPSSGLFIHGDQDRVAPFKEVTGLIEKLKTQKGIVIEHAVVEGANHFFENRVEPLIAQCRRLSRQAPRQSAAHRHPRARGLRPRRHSGRFVIAKRSGIQSKRRNSCRCSGFPVRPSACRE